MLLRHATPRRNLPGIKRAGLLTAKSQGRLPAVWFTCPSAASWAVLHVVRRHAGRVESVVILEVDVPRRWLRRSARKRLWYSLRDIGPDRIKRVFTFGEMAGASAES